MGFTATGLDIAPSAIPLAESKSADAAGQLSFRRGDFLRDEPFDVFDWVFEHTLFCAIDPTERPAYVAAAARWLKPDGQFLAIHYLDPEHPDGPPFGVTRTELEAAFSPAFSLLNAWMPRSYPNRVNRELMLWWKRR